jgi:alpha-D-xyloside xylohydrolase
MFNKYLIVVFLLAAALKGRPQSCQKTNHGLTATVGGIQVDIQFLSPDVIRVVKYPVGAGHDTGTSHYIGAGHPKNSFSVVQRPGKTWFTLTRENGDAVLRSKALIVRVDLHSGRICFYTAGSRLLLAEKDGGARFDPVEEGDSGTRAPAAFAHAAVAVAQAFTLKDSEAIYGLGQHQQGVMNYRNRTVVLRQKNMDIGIPFFQTSGGYGVFWDNYSTTTFRDSPGATTFASETGGCIDYYFMNGGDADQVIARMRRLTGNAPMFPRWAFGFWQSRERYKSQAELVGIVKKYRALKVPLDGIVQDWQYWGSNDSVWNSTEFGNPLYPDPQKMVDSVHALGAHMIISVWPSFGEATAIHREMQQAGALYDFKTWPGTPGVEVYDAFNSRARDIYWKYMNKNIFSLGMDGWWLDATEPEQADTGQSNNSMTAAGAFKSVCNAYPLLTTGGVYAHQRRATGHQRGTTARQRGTTGDKRVFILTRSAFAGQQRNAAAVWSGDIQGTWQVFRDQISGGLNLSLCGIPYWNTDIGGFYSAGKYPDGVKDPAFQTLYTRWLEFATFTPLFRSHGTNTPREIWQFGQKGYWAYDAQEKFINLRYRLLPYIYSTAWQVTSEQSTMMRALVMDFPTDRKVYDVNDEYMFGKSILVAPVTDSSGSRPVYLPEGSHWIDFWTGETFAGGRLVDYTVPIDRMPLFVKSGSILPFGPFEQYTSEKPADTLELRIYRGADGNFRLYEDENDNYDYEKGQYSTIDFRWNDRTATLTIGERKGAFPGIRKNRVFHLIKVDKNEGTGLGTGLASADGGAAANGGAKTIHYSGQRMQIKW